MMTRTQLCGFTRQRPFRPDPAFCASADAAAVLASFDERGFARTRDAAEAARLLVCFVFRRTGMWYSNREMRS